MSGERHNTVGRSGRVVEVDGVGGVDRAVGRERDLKGADLHVAGESGYGWIQPSGSEVGRTARIAEAGGGRAEGAVEELHRGRDGGGAVQRLGREAKGHDAQRAGAAG